MFDVNTLNHTPIRLSRSHLAARSLPDEAALHAAPAAVDIAEWQALLGGAALSHAELQSLNRVRVVSTWEAGRMVFTRSHMADSLVAVLEGAVGLGLARGEESFHLERTVRGPMWLDLSSAWLGASHAQDARTLTEARLVHLPLAQVRDALALHSALLDRLLVALARTVNKLTCATHDLMHKDAERRLAAWLLQRCPSPGSGQVLALSERKRDIAAQLAITPETFSRMMRQLKSKGVVEVHGYTVRVLDMPALQALAQD